MLDLLYSKHSVFLNWNELNFIFIHLGEFSSIQSLSHVQLFVTPWTAAHQASLSITNFWTLLKLMSIESVMPSNHLILCCSLLLPPSIFPSIKVFSNESVLLIRWSKYWSFRFSISSSNGYSGLISFRMDWLDLLVIQGTLKSLLQHHSSKAYMTALAIRERQIKTTKRFYFTLNKIVTIKKSDNDRCWWECGKIGTLIYCQWECKIV